MFAGVMREAGAVAEMAERRKSTSWRDHAILFQLPMKRVVYLVPSQSGSSLMLQGVYTESTGRSPEPTCFSNCQWLNSKGMQLHLWGFMGGQLNKVAFIDSSHSLSPPKSILFSTPALSLPIPSLSEYLVSGALNKHTHTHTRMYAPFILWTQTSSQLNSISASTLLVHAQQLCSPSATPSLLNTQTYSQLAMSIHVQCMEEMGKGWRGICLSIVFFTTTTIFNDLNINT